MPRKDKETQAQPAVPQALGPEAVYDIVMGLIEPDLMSAQLPLLTEKYAKETPEETIARMERYDRAFALFDKAIADLSTIAGDAAREWKGEVQRFLQEEESRERGGEIAAAEAALGPPEETP